MVELVVPVQSVLNILAQGLSIRYTEQKLVNLFPMKFLPFVQYKPVSDEVQETFKNELKAQLEESAQELPPSSVIYLSCYFGKVRGNSLLHYGSPVASLSAEMAEAISKLPQLNDEETYGFQYPTSACFRLNSDKEFEVDLEKLSPWILDNISDS